jgi:hypothetical protein
VLRGRGSSQRVSSSSHISSYNVQDGVIARVTPPSLARSGPRNRGGHTHPQPTPRKRRAAVEEIVEREQQAHEPQVPRGPRAEAFGVYLRDLRNFPGSKIRRLRSVLED